VEYNLDLVKPLGLKGEGEKILFPLTPEEKSFARDLLKERGIAPGSSYVIIHPGHKGSALNWKPQRYAHLISRLIQKNGLKVVVTGAMDETPLISEVTTHLQSHSPDHKPVLLIGACTLRQLAGVYEGAQCFISASTGTMHLAAAVGTPTVALFCPIPQTSPVRWGPWGNPSTILMPKNLDCPECKLGTCQRHDPMDAISIEEVLEAVEKYIPHDVRR
jgi:ADP-heptose:LPS heptosyltransferase